MVGNCNYSLRQRKHRKFLLSSYQFPLKLNVGCGNIQQQQERDKKHGYIGIDICDFGQDIIWDIEEGLPFPDNSCSHIYCSHVVEHVQDMMNLMNEFWRCLRKDGELHIVCPSKNHEHAYIVTHIRQLDETTFKMFDISWRPEEEWFENYDVLPWKINELVTNHRGDIHFKAQPYKEL